MVNSLCGAPKSSYGQDFGYCHESFPAETKNLTKSYPNLLFFAGGFHMLLKNFQILKKQQQKILPIFSSASYGFIHFASPAQVVLILLSVLTVLGGSQQPTIGEFES